MARSIFIISAMYAGGSVLIKATGLILIPVYTQYLAVEEYGVLAILNLFLQLLSFFMVFGVNAACMRFYFERDISADQKRQLYGNGVLMLLLWPVLMVLICIPVLGFIMESWLPDIPFYPYMVLVIAIAFFRPIRILMEGLLRAQERPGFFLAQSLGFFLTQCLCIIVLIVIFEKGVEGQLIGQLMACIIFWIIALLILRPHISIKPSKKLMTDISVFGVSLAPYFVFTWLNAAMRVFVLQWFGTLSDVGIYQIAIQFASIAVLLSNAVDNGLLPRFYKIASDPDSQSEQAVFIRKYIAFFSIVSLLVVIVSPPLILWVADEGYHQSIHFIGILVFSNWLMIVGKPFIWWLLHNKSTARISGIYAIGGGIQFITLIGLLKYFDLGIWGVGMAFIVSSGVIILMSYIRVSGQVKFHLQWSKMISTTILPYLIAMVLISASLFTDVMSIHFVYACTAGIASILFVIWKTGLHEDIKREYRQAIGRIRTGAFS